jgi:hypothetical protein
MRKSHELLLQLFHDPKYDFSKVTMEYVDRGSPGDRSIVSGVQVTRLDAQYIEVDAITHTACIPYHRLRNIFYDDTEVWGLHTDDKNESMR